MRQTLILGLLASLTAGSLPYATAEQPTSLRIPTAYVEYAVWSKERKRDDPTDKVGQQPPQPLPVAMARPEGIRKAPDAAVAAYATLRAGGRDVSVMFVPGEGSQGTLLVDRNGDGDLTQEGESFAVTGAEGGNGRTFWWAPSCAIGDARVGITFWRVPQALWSAQASSGGTTNALRLQPSPPGNPKAPRLQGTVLLATAPGKSGGVLVGFVARGEDVTAVVDANGNQDLSDDGEGTIAVRGTAPEGKRGWDLKDLSVGGSTTTIRLEEQRKDLFTCQVSPSGARRGTVDVGGVPHALHLLDRDFDGAWTSPADRWWFGPVEACGKLRELNASSMFEGNEAVLGPTAWRLVSVDGEGNATLAPDAAAGSCSAYFARRSERVRQEWFAKFDAEAAEFRKANGIDPARPKAKHPIHWMHDVDLAAALARAKAEGKPVLVDFEADWCQWCYRFEYYLYPDAEVAALVEQFVPVKINFEFHTAGEFERLQAPRSLPVLFVLDAAGEPVTFPLTGPDGKTEETFRIARFLPPDRLAAALQAALAAWRKKQG